MKMVPPVLFWMEPSVRGIAFMAWARSSAVEHTLHTGGVAGSIPAAPTIKPSEIRGFYETHSAGENFQNGK